MSPPVGFGVIGAGAIAQRHMQALERIGGLQARWVVSRRADAAGEFARQWRIAHAGTSIEPLLADWHIELVLITSPSALHSPQAIQAMQAGKDVIVEIPVALNWTDAEKVAQVAAMLGRRVWVCHTMRSFAAMRETRHRIQSGRLRVTQIAGFFGIPRRRNQGMGNVGTRSWIDNLLWHHGCHQVDASLWVLGMPSVPRVQALLGRNHPTLGMSMDVGVQMITAGGELITQALSYNVEHVSWGLRFIGTEDVLTYANGGLTNEAGEVLVPETALDDLTIQDQEIMTAWRTGESCEYDLSKVLPTMEVLGRAQRSAEKVTT